MLKLYGAKTHEPQRVDSYKLCLAQLQYKIKRIYVFFSVKDRNLLQRVDTIGNIFTSGTAMSENITNGVHEMK